MALNSTAGSVFDVVCFGESMIQFIPLHGSLESAPQFGAQVGGAESNVAIGLARLGDSVAWASRVGSDAFGRRLRSSIEAQGVDVALVEEDAHRPTGIFFKEPTGESRRVFYYRAGSAASAMDEPDGRRAVAAARRITHLSGITPALSPSCDRAVVAALESARDTGVIVSFDVNHRPSLWPSVAVAGERLAQLGRLADITFVGLDEAAVLWGCESAEAVRGVFEGSRLDGPVLVVKDAPRRVTVFTADEVVELDLPPVDVVEAVGAGDAFAAGYLHGVLLGWPVIACVRAGHVLAASALSSLSDQGAEISAADLERAVDPTVWSTRTVSR